MIAELEALARIAEGMVVPVAFAAAAVTLATSSAPPNRHTCLGRPYVSWGWALSLVGLCLMALSAWSAYEDSHYGALEAIGLMLMALTGAGLLLLGLGPFASRLLEILAGYAERLPLPVRLAARDLAGRREITASAITVTAMATALGIALTVVAVGMTGQSSAQYVPRARPGALLVGYFEAGHLGDVRAAVQRELPGVPVTQTETLSGSLFGDQTFNASADDVDLSDESAYWSQVIGDETLLRYLTGDQATPYDPDKAVVVTTDDVRVDSVEIDYRVNGRDSAVKVETIPAVVAGTVDPHMETIFIPAKIARDRGLRLVPNELIVDPSLHRASEDERARLRSRLGDIADAYVERGYQPMIGWRVVAAALLLLALGGASATGIGAAARARPGQVLRRAGAGSAALRWFGASRAGMGALCGVVLGALAGCPVGMLLIWPLTMSTTWEDPPRVLPFETPWAAVAAVVVGLPVLAAALGGLLVRERAVVARDYSRRSSAAGR
ncbi:hypothetical protein [Nonomuraea roseoviolacea]|uniref:Tellurite resistance protein TehA-like permease n=1 Tax=Nonomuraea roseoviolacea subsp. carminata TaxID=160689 RepID=A0ABT1JTL1_9ACTN|nr:hypothetical protein [Nonomuraea roseoviolacea]MCP2344679.1 tellurite resistance protein TehA-like permease [Nonomuraea roseoviolacea subsp. carminata]